jgi:hypothetical protein
VLFELYARLSMNETELFPLKRKKKKKKSLKDYQQQILFSSLN